MRVANLLLPDIRDALGGPPEALRELVAELHPADTADLFLALDAEEQTAFLKALPIPDQVIVLEELEADVRAQIFESYAPELAERLVAEMSADEAADLFRNLTPILSENLLARMPRDEARELRSLLAWPEGTCGAMMTTDFVALDAELSASEAIDRIRRVAEEKETIYYAYAVSPEGSLRGVISLRELVTAKPDRRVSDLMESEHVITVRATDEQRQAAQVISKYDLLAVPVVDDAGRLLGIVTVDDVVDVVEDEVTEDVQRMAGMVPLDDSYFRTSFFRMLRSRAGWLVVLFVGEFFTGTALRHYEDSFAEALALVFFIPLIVSAGGNAGSQSAGLLIRALAVGEVVPRQAWKVALREAASGLILGLLLAAIGMGRALLWPEVHFPVALVVGLAVLFVVFFGGLVGGLMPIAIKKVGLDPAVSSAPLIATLIDVTGLIIYFQIAQVILGLP